MGEAAGSGVPSDTVWQGVEARVDALDGADNVELPMTGRRGPAGWSIVTAIVGLGAAAAALVLFLSTPATSPVAPPQIASTPGDQLVAQLGDDETNRSLASRIDPDSGELRLAISGLQADTGKTPELWVIPAGGAPISLGAIPEEGDFSRDLSTEESALLVAGATLAVTFEDDTGERHETPTMPILLAGALAEV
nr:anti-sigma factor [Qipengyuania qiaonensis]